MLSHQEQRQRLARSCPAALSVALVAGDPCFDRIRLSRPLRESYRHAFGLTEYQRLVVISSTWGEKSLFGQCPDLPMRLAEQLPLDEFRIVVALHPNIWFGHSPGQLKAWLADCERAGIVVLPPEEGWRAALVAADLTIGDYGSVTFYSAAQGAPVLLTTRPTELLDPASPIAALLAAAPQLDPKRRLVDQVRDAIADHSPDQYAHITGQTTSEPGRAHTLLRTAIYGQLRLSEPDAPASTSAVPMPTRSAQPIQAQLIGVQTGDAGVEVSRFPAEVLYRTPEVARGRFLVVGTNQPRQAWLERADALVRDSAGPVARWIDGSLAALPGALAAAARDESGQWVIGDRAGRLLRFVRVGSGPLSADDGACCAALVCSGAALPERVTLLRNGNGLVVRVISQAAATLPRVPSFEEIIRQPEPDPTENPWVNGPPAPETVTIVAYNPEWPHRYQALSSRIHTALGDVAVNIEHVGSTSVEGLAAKDVIDVDLVVADPRDEDGYVPALERLGYVLVVREPSFYQHRLLRLAEPRVNLHVFGPDSPEIVRHRMFRDWLRAHPEDRMLYEDAKRAAVPGGGTVMDYNRRKQEVIHEIYDRLFRAAGML